MSIQKINNLLTRKARSWAFVVMSCLAMTFLMGGGSLLVDNSALAKSAQDSDISTQADEAGTTSDGNGAEVKVDVNVTSMLSLAAYPVGDHTAETDQVALSPVPGAGLATNMLDLVVRTNVETGYQLSIRDKDSSAALVSIDDSTRTIPTLTTNTNTAGFPDNYWGYSVGAYNADNSEFYGVPTDAPTVIAQSDKLLPGDGETTTVTFGAKVNSAVAEGLYEDIVLYSHRPIISPFIIVTRMVAKRLRTIPRNLVLTPNIALLRRRSMATIQAKKLSPAGSVTKM